MSRRLTAAAALAAFLTALPGAATAKVTPPPGTPNLAAAALRLADLPPGVTISRQGYVTPDNAVATYEREFETVGARRPIGATTLISLEHDVELNRSPLVVSTAISVLKALPASALQRLFAAGVASSEGAGVIKSIRVSRFPVRGVGDTAVGIRGTFQTPLGPAAGVFLFVKVGRVADNIFAVGPGGKVRPADIVALARKAVAHTRAVLAKR